MYSLPGDQRRTNWLLNGLIVVSLGAHVLIFMHVAGICRTDTLTYIEIGIKNISKPVGRPIPRPRTRQRPIYKTPKINTINIPKRNITPVKINQMKIRLPDTLMESIEAPDLPSVPEQSNISISDLKPDSISGFKPDNVSDFLTKNEYFDMLRLKIESNKKYPDTARLRNIEGRVRIYFIIAKDGRISDLKIVRPARHNSLNKAALKAVRNSAPFPVPPSNLFQESLKIELTIVFELA